MEAVILAGGFGTRLSEETGLRPKPMVEINGVPILVHIMSYLYKFGIKDFYICLGYKSSYIKNYFFQQMMCMGNITLDFESKRISQLSEIEENYKDWKINFIETGLNNMTGSRLKQALKFIKGNNFIFTYGDGLTNQNINDLLDSHFSARKLATVTAVQPPGRFGSLKLDMINSEASVNNFAEKPKDSENWINGGYFVLNRNVEKYLSDEECCTWEKEPLVNLAKDGELNAFIHKGFWKPMDTLKDKKELENLLINNKAPWINE